MSLNKKTWVFVEGESEAAFVTSIVRNHFLSDITKSEFVFVENAQPMVHITICNGGSDIPYAINRNSYKFLSRSDTAIMVVSDTEDIPCPAEKKHEVIHKLDTAIDTSTINFVFSIPEIEEIYCYEHELTLDITYKMSKCTDLSLRAEATRIITDNSKSPIYRLKKAHKTLNPMSCYKKVTFANSFFNQLDFDKCSHPTVKRLVTLLT